ncbi:MAG: thioredoxin family protein [Acidimicrobiia bacterium]|nr:thioredoxin family protein [Acidimicrobiia bacterium]
MRRLILLVSCALVVGACGSSSTPALAIVANSPGTLTPGPERLVIGLITEDGTWLAAPDRPAVVTITGPNGASTQVGAEFVWMLDGVRGVYTAMVDFDRAGTWELAVDADGVTAEPTPFAVETVSLVPGVGTPAVASVTATLADGPIETITTDPNPDPSLYEVSLDEALSEGRPIVVVFSTPAFCQTATCGPTLEIAKEIKATTPDVRFVHVEVYTNLEAGRFEDLELVPAIDEWGLPSEPWVFVIGSDGIITAEFEGMLSARELADALERTR